MPLPHSDSDPAGLWLGNMPISAWFLLIGKRSHTGQLHLTALIAWQTLQTVRLSILRISSLLLMEYPILPARRASDLLLFSWFFLSFSLCLSVCLLHPTLTSHPLPIYTHSPFFILIRKRCCVMVSLSTACMLNSFSWIWPPRWSSGELTTKFISSTSPDSTKMRVRRFFFKDKENRERNSNRFSIVFRRCKAEREVW